MMLSDTDDNNQSQNKHFKLMDLTDICPVIIEGILWLSTLLFSLNTGPVTTILVPVTHSTLPLSPFRHSYCICPWPMLHRSIEFCQNLHGTFRLILLDEWHWKHNRLGGGHYQTNITSQRKRLVSCTSVTQAKWLFIQLQCHWIPDLSPQIIPMCASLNARKDKGLVGEVWYILYSSSTMCYFCYILS